MSNLIDREDLLYHLDKNLSDLRAEGWSCKKLWKMVLQTIWGAPTETVNEWIPVERELPEIGEYVLTCGKQGGMETIIFRGLLCKDGSRDIWAWKKNSSKRIIAWKPIEPYTGDNQ